MKAILEADYHMYESSNASLLKSDFSEEPNVVKKTHPRMELARESWNGIANWVEAVWAETLIQ